MDAKKKARDNASMRATERTQADDADMVRGVVVQAMHGLRGLKAPQLIDGFAFLLARTLAYRTRAMKEPAVSIKEAVT